MSGWGTRAIRTSIKPCSSASSLPSRSSSPVREGHGEEARTILRSIADVDASFTPAQRLEQAISAGAPVDLAQLIGEVAARGDVDVDATVAKARQALAQRDFQGALTSSKLSCRSAGSR